jgi:hypothetical protein
MGAPGNTIITSNSFRQLAERRPVIPKRSNTWKSALLALFRARWRSTRLFLGRRPGFLGLLVNARAGRDR